MNFIKRLLGLHTHTYGPWTVHKTFTNAQGIVKIIQVRECSTCHYKDYDSTEI